jgi:hypothetical protein
VLLTLLCALLRLLIELLILRGRPTAGRDLELLALRQELLVIRRTARRPGSRTADRLILAALGSKLSPAAGPSPGPSVPSPADPRDPASDTCLRGSSPTDY